MGELLKNIALAGILMPPACDRWQAELVELHVASDWLIALAYFSIPALLVYFARQRKDLPFRGAFWLLATFLIFNGSLHLIEIWTLWNPANWLSGVLKAMTAVISAYTAFKLTSIIPLALALPSPAQLETANRSLQAEIAERSVAAAEIKQLVSRLEQQGRILDAILADSPDRISLYDRVGKYTYASLAVANALGLAQSAILGQTWRDLGWPKETTDALEAEREAVFSTGQPARGEIRLPSTEGLKDYEYILSPVAGAGGEVEAVVLVAKDISDRLRTQQEYESFFSLSLDMLCIAGFDGYFKRVNPAWERTLGYSSEELFAQPFIEFVHPEDRAATLAQAETLIAGQAVHAFENRYRCKDGSYRWLVWDSAPQAYRGTIYAVVRDITERKQAEAALRQYQENLEELVAARTAELERANTQLQQEVSDRVSVQAELDRIFTLSADMLCILGADGYFKRVNPAVEGILGYTPEEFMAQHWSEFVHPDDREATLAAARELLDRGETILYFNNRYRCKDGSYKWMSWSSVPVPQEGTIYAIARDVTPLRETEEALERRSLAIEAATDGIAILDKNGEYVYMNQAHAQTYGYDSPEELLGKTWKILYHDSELKRFETQVMPEFFIKGAWRGEAIGKKRDGTSYPQELSLTGLEDGGLICIVRDIAERKQAEEALRASEARYQSLAEASPVGIFYTDASGDCLYVNEQWCAIAGMTPDEAIGQGWANAIHPEDRDRVFAQWYRAAGENVPFKSEYRFQRPDGKVTWVFAQALAELTDDGSVKSYVGTIADISDRISAEEEIKQLNENLERRVAERTIQLEATNTKLLYEIVERQRIEENLRQVLELQRAILDGANYTIISTDIDGTIDTFNKAAERLLGYSAEEVLGKVTPAILHDGEEVCKRAATLTAELGVKIEPGFEVFVAKARQGIADENEWTYIRKDGSRFPVQLSVTGLFDGAGNISGFVGIGSDISDRKRTEEALRLSEERYALAVYGSSDGLWDWNVLTGDVYYSPRWKEIIGYEDWEIEHHIDAFAALLHPDDKARVFEAVREHFEQKMPYQIEFRMREKSGEYRWILARGQAIWDETGKAMRMAGSHTDISDRKLAEQQLLQLADELRRSNQELEQFAYVASHDLQEPLRAVTSYTQLLSQRYQGNLDAKADKWLAYIIDGATRMQQLINDLLAYSRVGTKGKELEPTDCSAVLDRTLANLQVAIAEKNATVTRDSLPVVMGDEGQLVQLFQNLIGNAIKFCREDMPIVQISAVQKDSEWLFAVRDNGIGIEPEYAERIFIIFQRLHSRRDYAGTGIGLAICKRIVERHGGRIWVESQLGEGATFYFTFPLLVE